MDKPDFEEFIQRFETGDANKNYIFIAKDHEKIIGLTYSWTDKKETGIYFTGVLQEFRGNGIATSLKITLANYLSEQNFKKLLTNNRDTNYAILQSNKKLGFVKQSRIFYYRKKVQ